MVSLAGTGRNGAALAAAPLNAVRTGVRIGTAPRALRAGAVLKAGRMGPGLAARRGRAGGRLELMALRLGTGSGTFTTCRLPEGGRFTYSIAVFGDKFQLEIQIQTLSCNSLNQGIFES